MFSLTLYGTEHAISAYVLYDIAKIEARFQERHCTNIFVSVSTERTRSNYFVNYQTCPIHSSARDDSRRARRVDPDVRGLTQCWVMLAPAVCRARPRAFSSGVNKACSWTKEPCGVLWTRGLVRGGRENTTYRLPGCLAGLAMAGVYNTSYILRTWLIAADATLRQHSQAFIYITSALVRMTPTPPPSRPDQPPAATDTPLTQWIHRQSFLVLNALSLIHI